MLNSYEYVEFGGDWSELQEEFQSEPMANMMFRSIFGVLQAMTTGNVIYMSSKLKIGLPSPTGKIYKDHFEMTLDWSRSAENEKQVQVHLWYALSCHYFQSLLASNMIRGFYPSIRMTSISYTITF